MTVALDGISLNSVREAITFVFFIALGLNFLISGILVNVLQFVLWVTIKPLSKTFYRKLNYYCTYAVWGQLEFLAEWWSSSVCYIHTDEETWAKVGTEHGILLLNHSYEVDWLFSWFLCEQASILGGAKALVKKTFKKVPIIGWTAYFSENAFLERNWDKDKEVIEQQISNLATNPDPVMIHLFAEGTRFTSAKHAASVEFAKKSGLPPLKHLLIPRTKGFTLCVDTLRGKSFAIYCATIVFNTKQGAAPVFKSLVLGRPVIAEILLERIPLDSLPTDAQDISNWLHQNYIHKDNVIDTYKAEGKLPSQFTGHHFNGPIKVHYRPRRLWTMLFMLASCSMTLPPVLGAFFSLLSSGIVNTAIAILLLALVVYALLKLMDLSSASKGSEYGRSSKTN